MLDVNTSPDSTHLEPAKKPLATLHLSVPLQGLDCHRRNVNRPAAASRAQDSSHVNVTNPSTESDQVHLSFYALLSAHAVQRRNCLSEATRPRGHGVISIRLHYEGDIWVVKIGSS